MYAKKCVNLRQILSRDKQRKTILKIICFLESVFGIEDGVGLVYLALGWYILYILSTNHCKISGFALTLSGYTSHSLLHYMGKIVCHLEKRTPTTLVALMTNISYVVRHSTKTKTHSFALKQGRSGMWQQKKCPKIKKRESHWFPREHSAM